MTGQPQRPKDDMIPGCVPAPGLAIVTGSKMWKSRPDRRLLFDHAIGIDIEAGEGVDIICDLEQPFAHLLPDVVSHVDCVSTMEHVSRPWLAAQNIQAAMRSGATIFFSAPFVWREHGPYPHDLYRYSPASLKFLFEDIEWTHLRYMSQRDGLTEEYPKPSKDEPFLVPRCETHAWGVKR